MRSPLRSLTPSILDVLQRVAGEHMQRRIEAQKLLDRRLGAVEGRALFEHRLHAVAERVHGRLVAGVEQQHDRSDEFILAELSFLALRGDEVGDEIVARMARRRSATRRRT